ncbi:MAG: ATP-binding cassette domain-containing protein [Anaerolineales bacterium]|jgi:simple sugar transport system ATP-binding protein
MNVVLKDIRKYFGEVKANDGISLTLESGFVYGLLGENGAGKSTLMKILSGYHQPDSGVISLGDQAVSFASPAEALAHGVGMIYQDPLDVPTMRVLDNYLLGRDNKVLLDREEASQALLQSASTLGFRINLLAYIDSLSLGERQQLELLRLLSLGAEVLILDEPTTGISSDQKEGLFDTIRKLAQEEGKTVILVSHKLAEVQELCQHVFVLRRGKLVGESDIPCPIKHLVNMMFEEVPPRPARTSHVLDEPAFELRNVSMSGERVTLLDIDLSVRAGEVFGLAGLEGSGQRLLLQACAGLVRPSKGEMLLQGRDVTRWGYRRMLDHGMAYLPAGRLEEGLVAGLTLMEHIALATPDRGFIIDRQRFTKETQARIDRYQIVGRPETRVDALSGGNQQRALFALLRTPLKLLLLEHPTRGLDVRSAEWIWSLLLQRVAEGTAIVFMSADLDELIDRSDRIVAFSGGEMSRVVSASDATADQLGHLIGGEQ